MRKKDERGLECLWAVELGVLCTMAVLAGSSGLARAEIVSMDWALMGTAVATGALFAVLQPTYGLPWGLWFVGFGVYYFLGRHADGWLEWEVVRGSAVSLILAHVGWGGAWLIWRRRRFRSVAHTGMLALWLLITVYAAMEVVCLLFGSGVMVLNIANIAVTALIVRSALFIGWGLETWLLRLLPTYRILQGVLVLAAYFLPLHVALATTFFPWNLAISVIVFILLIWRAVVMLGKVTVLQDE